MTLPARQSGITRPGPKKIALMLVDFQQKHRNWFSYEHGSLSEGIAKTVSVAESARSMGVPIILVSGKKTRDIFPEIEEAAGPGALRIYKSTMDAFLEPDLETILGALDVGAIAIGGWIRHLCVMKTASEAIARGFFVHTSDEILFGNREFANLAARRMCLLYFCRNGTLYESASDLIIGMTKIACPDAVPLQAQSGL